MPESSVADATQPATPVSFPVFAAVAAGITGRGVYEVIELVGRIFEGAGAVFEGSPDAPGTLIALLPPSDGAAVLAVQLALRAQGIEQTLRIGVDATEVRSKREQDAKWQQVIDNALRLQKAARTGEAIAEMAIDGLSDGIAWTEALQVGDETYLLLTGVRERSGVPVVSVDAVPTIPAVEPPPAVPAEELLLDEEPRVASELEPRAETASPSDGGARPAEPPSQENDGWARPVEDEAPQPEAAAPTEAEPASEIGAEPLAPEAEAERELTPEPEVIAAPEVPMQPEPELDVVVEPIVPIVPSAHADVPTEPEVEVQQEPAADAGTIEQQPTVAAISASEAPSNTSPWDGALIGRDAQLADLRARYERVVGERVGSCVSIAGEPGSGRSRLVRELAASLDGARILTVVCGPAFGGAARWPLAALVEALADIDPLAPAEPARARLAELFAGEPDAERVVPHLAAMLGLDGVTEADRIRWALRRLIEVGAGEAPLLIAIEDADRAGAALPHLLADVATAVRDAPVLFTISTARESDGIPAIRLGPLTDADMAALVTELLGAVEDGVDTTIAARLHGSPLALEQVLALLTESGTLAPGQGRWMPLADLARVPFPDTTPAAIRQRLQTLPPHELIVLGMSAVAGEHFDVEPLVDAVPGDARAGVPASLQDLVDRGFLVGGPDRYSFRHPLLRAATLPGVPDWARSTTHERIARHLERSAGDRRARFAEEIGGHLEAGCRDRPEASSDDRADALAHLSSAAEAAIAQGDLDGASRLERLASSLTEDERQRAELLYLAAEHGALADPDRAADHEIADAAITPSSVEEVDQRVRLLRARMRSADPRIDSLENARAVANEVIEAAPDGESSWALANAWSLLGVVHARRSQSGSVVDDLTRAAEHARAVGRRAEATAALRGAAAALLDAPIPVDEAERRSTAFIEDVDGPLAEHDIRSAVAVLQARRGAPDDARASITASISALEELGAAADLAVALHRAAEIELLAGQPQAADPLMQRALAAATNARDEALRARLAAAFAHVLITDDERLDEATALTDLAEADASDMGTQVGWRMARARIMVRQSRAPQAERIAREGLGIAEQTDSTDLRADALLWAADVRRQAGRPAEAEPFERRALRLLERAHSTAKANALRAKLSPTTAERPAASDEADERDAQPPPPADTPEPGPTLADEMMTMFGSSDGEPEPPASAPEPPLPEADTVPPDQPSAEIAPEDELLDDPTSSAHEGSNRRWFNR